MPATFTLTLDSSVSANHGLTLSVRLLGLDGTIAATVGPMVESTARPGYYTLTTTLTGVAAGSYAGDIVDSTGKQQGVFSKLFQYDGTNEITKIPASLNATDVTGKIAVTAGPGDLADPAALLAMTLGPAGPAADLSGVATGGEVAGVLAAVEAIPATPVTLPTTPPAGYGGGTQDATGPYIATIPVVDNLGNPLQGVSVSLVDGAITYPAKTTDVNGQVTFNRPNGTYALLTYKSGYSDATGTVVVNGANVTAAAIVMTVVASPPAPPIPSVAA